MTSSNHGDAAKLKSPKFSEWQTYALNAIREAVIVSDREGVALLVNAAYQNLFGETKDRQAIHPREHESLAPIYAKALAGERVHSEVGMQLGGLGYVFAVSAQPFDDGVIMVFEDKTRSRRNEKIRRDFIANASHELRTPLTAIRGFAETLRDGAMEDPAFARRFVDTIIENTKRLESLVNDMLEIARLEAPSTQIELGRTDCFAVVEEAVRALGSLSHAAKVSVVVALECDRNKTNARANERALDQVLLNLLSNAIKFSPEGTRVEVTLSHHDNDVVIDVCDHGPGIPETKIPRIFERFYRIDRGRSRDAGGTGLGLAIVKELVEHMQGHIEVESELGKLTRFRVRLPAMTDDVNVSGRHEDNKAVADS